MEENAASQVKLVALRLARWSRLKYDIRRNEIPKRVYFFHRPISTAKESLSVSPTNRRQSATELHLPGQMNYDCLMCGRGCTDFWEIPLDPESENELSELPLKDLQQRHTELPPFVDSQFEEGERALCRVDDVCVFMTPDCKCSLHAAHGHLAKPQTCIDFPFRYVDTAAGTFVGLSFACSAVLQDHGAPVEIKRDSLSENYVRSIHVKSTARRPKLTSRIDMEFDAYAEIEKAFDEILSIPNTPLSIRLLAQSVLLDLIVKAFEAARLNESKLPLSEEERKAAQSAGDVQLAQAMIERFRREQWGRLLLIAQRQHGSAALNRAFIGLITTFRQALWRDANRLRALTYIARHYISHALRLGRVHLKPFASDFPYYEFKKRQPDKTPGSEYDLLLTRYFRHTLFRKDLLLSESVRAGHRFILMHFALINRYITAMMVDADTTQATPEMMQEALCHVEKYYVHHSTYGKYLENQPMLSTLIDWAINTSAFAASMVREPI